jgi:oligopeptide/dipeptide ABC transporter ATP-binding protein
LDHPQETRAVTSDKKDEEILLNVKDLKTYLYTSKGVVKAVDGISFEIKRGEILGLVGESGCGKTMTALSIARLLPSPPAKIVGGSIEMGDLDFARISDSEMRLSRGSKVSMIFQDPLSSLNPLMKIGTQIAEAIYSHKNMPKKEALARAVEILKLVGIPDAESRASEFPFELSGGMRQRVMIAIALAADPLLIIADEPTTNLDATIQAQILSLLKKIRDVEGTSILLITHNLGIVAWICDRVAVMYAGKIVEAGSAKDVLGTPLHPYTRALLKSVPRVDTQKGKLDTIPGDVPNLKVVGLNCDFNPRCPHARSICKTAVPEDIEVGQEHKVKCFIYSKEWNEIKR